MDRKLSATGGGIHSGVNDQFVSKILNGVNEKVTKNGPGVEIWR